MNCWNEEKRRKYLVEEVKRDKKEIGKDVAILAGSSLAVGVGILGVILYGDDLINAYKIDSYTSVLIYDSIISVSSLSALSGIYSAVLNAKRAIEDFRDLKNDKIKLKTFEEKVGRTK